MKLNNIYITKIIIVNQILLCLLYLDNFRCVRLSSIPSLLSYQEKLFYETKHKICKHDEDEGVPNQYIKIGINLNVKFPIQKPNRFIKHGWGDSAYLFDYLDSLLQKLISEKFGEYFNLAKTKLSVEKKYTEIRNVYINTKTNKKIIGEIVEDQEYINYHDIFPQATNDEMLEKQIKMYIKDFNYTLYKNSISLGAVKKAFSDWNWGEDTLSYSTVDLFENCDINGDGRLSLYEFSLLNILTNSNNKNCTNCFSEITKEYISPIFTYIVSNCNDSKQVVTSFSMWKGLKTLKRETNGYNMYNCYLKKGNYHTSAVNDFILKNGFNGYANKKQFIKGILLGYLNRQTKDNNFYLDNQINDKLLRWSENGFTDLKCFSIKLQQ